MPRLFTGLEIPSALADELALMRGGLSGARWIDVENYHLTLRFIGDIDDSTADEVDADAPADPTQAVHGDARGAGLFRRRQAPGHRGQGTASPPLVELQAEQERLMRRIGIPPEPRRFVPHVTLARLRQAPARAVADYLGTRGFLKRRFEAEQFVLYSARDSVGGGPYVIEAAYPLG